MIKYFRLNRGYGLLELYYTCVSFFTFLLVCSVIVEAVKMDSLQKLCSTLEPLLRRVVSISCPAYVAAYADLREQTLLRQLKNPIDIYCVCIYIYTYTFMANLHHPPEWVLYFLSSYAHLRHYCMSTPVSWKSNDLGLHLRSELRIFDISRVM